MIHQWIIYHDYNNLEYYKEYQNYQNYKENIFPDRPEEAAMFDCKSLSTKRFKSVPC